MTTKHKIIKYNERTKTIKIQLKCETMDEYRKYCTYLEDI